MKTKLVLICCLVLALCAFKCGGDEDWTHVSDGSVPISDDNKQLTPRGADVFGKFQVPSEQLALTDAGLTDAFDAAVKSGYDKALDYAHYRIWTPDKPCVLSPLQQVPSFLIRADAYDGTEWDQHNDNGPGVRDGIGVVYAAEQVRSVGTPGSNPPKGEMIVCPSTTHMQNAVRYGAEHIIIANNDQDYFGLTWYHNHFYHPLLPKRDTPDVPFAAKEDKAFLGLTTPPDHWVIEPVK